MRRSSESPALSQRLVRLPSARALALVSSLGFAFSLASCGGMSESGARVQSLSKAPPPLLIAMDGYNTCKDEGSPNDARFAPLARAATRGLDARVILSCFGDTTWSFNLRVSSPTSADSRLRAGVAVGSFPEFYEIIRQESTPDTPIVIMGHSHGGWLALETIGALQGSRNIRELVTADAISYTECTASRMVESLLGSIFGEAYPGCTQAPPDLAPRFPTVRRGLARWENFFQDDFSLLHSSSIPSADRNTQLSYDFQGFDIYRAHGSTAVDAKVWTVVRARLALYSPAAEARESQAAAAVALAP